jgi:hypothetical protein
VSAQKKDYTVTVSMMYEAENPADAIMQMVDHLQQFAQEMIYHVEDSDGNTTMLDAEVLAQTWDQETWGGFK